MRHLMETSNKAQRRHLRDTGLKKGTSGHRRKDAQRGIDRDQGVRDQGVRDQGDRDQGDRDQRDRDQGVRGFTKDEENVRHYLASLRKPCRRCVRHSERLGAKVCISLESKGQSPRVSGAKIGVVITVSSSSRAAAAADGDDHTVGAGGTGCRATAEGTGGVEEGGGMEGGNGQGHRQVHGSYAEGESKGVLYGLRRCRQVLLRNEHWLPR